MKPSGAASLSFIEPMQALLVGKLPEGDWLYEVKLDGYRALAFKDGKEVRVKRARSALHDQSPERKAIGTAPELHGNVARLDSRQRLNYARK
jgi:bifunctional non-homologous end joining protein LigD